VVTTIDGDIAIVSFHAKARELILDNN